MRIISPFLIYVLEQLSSLKFQLNHNELVITMVLRREKCGLHFHFQFVSVKSVLSF